MVKPNLQPTRPTLPGSPATNQLSETSVPETSRRLVGVAGVRVLVVDDNSDQVMMLTGGLQLNGFSVQSASTGPDGLATALQWRPDIVLLDIRLPGLDGYEVARRLRTAEAKERESKSINPPRRMRLIALTGRDRDTDKALAREVGFDAHLTKPCDPNYLAMMMAALAPERPAP